MMRIIKESLQDVSDYLRSSGLKEELVNELPKIVDSPESVEYGVNDYIVSLVQERFPDEPEPQITDVMVIKVQGDDTEIVSSDHEVIEFNGVLYDYTAHQFSNSYNNLLSWNSVPVTQPVITNDRQINDGVSSVKYYALLKV